MTDTKAMEIAMFKADVKKGDLAKELGMSRTGLYNKMHNRSAFRISEVSAIKRVLGLTDYETTYIFFAD